MREIETGGGRGAPSRSRRPRPAPHASTSRPMVLAPGPSGVFADTRPAAPSLGGRRAAQQVARAKRRVNRDVSVAPVPKLANATRAQRQAATEQASRSLARQGIHTAADVASLSPAARARAHRLLGYAGTERKYDNAETAVRLGLGAGARSVRELAARGAAAVASGQVPLASSRGDRKQSVGIGPLQLGTVNTSALARTLLGATSLGGASAENALVRNAIGDVGSIGEAPFVGGVQAAKAAYDLSPVGVHDFKLWEPYTKTPDTSTATDLAKGVGQSLLHSSPGELLTGHPGKAAEAFREHPVLSALDYAGAASVVGRSAGALTRAAGSTTDAAGMRGALARAGSRVRPPVALVDEPGASYARRDYSGDLLRKLVQAGADRTRSVVTDAEGNAVRVRDRGREVPLMRPRSGRTGVPGSDEAARLARRRADFEASRANAVERLARDEETHRVMKVPRGQKVGRRGEQVISKVVEGVVRPGRFREDLDKRIGAIEARLAAHESAPPGRSPYRDRDEVRQAREELHALRAVRSNPKAMRQAERIVAEGRRQGRALNAQEAEANRLGVVDPNLRRSALMPYAISHMDARHFTVEEHGRLEAAARQSEKAARAKVDRLPKGPARAQALADWREARRQRIEVSGRDPAGVHAHEALQVDVRRARAAHQRAQTDLRRAQDQRQRLIGRARAPIDAADARRLDRQRTAIERKVARAQDRERVARAARTDAESKLAGSRMPQARAALRHGDGRFLSNDAIEAHMRANGVDPADVAFLSHRELGNSAYHARMDPSTRPVLAGERRTGAAHARGSSGFGPEQVRDEAARKATRNAKADQVDRIIRDGGLKHPAMAKAARGERLTAHEERVVRAGGHFTPREAAEVARRYEADTGKRLVPVRAFSSRMSRDLQSQVRGLQDPAALEAFPGQLINDRILNLGDQAQKRRGARNVVLMSEDEINRLQQHLTPAGELEKMVQALNGPFRFTVLAQPRWLAGNFVEPYLIRLPASGSGMVNVPGMLNDIRIARKTIRAMKRSGDPRMVAAARELEAQQEGGLFIGNRGASVRRRVSDSDSAPARALAYVRHLPVVKQMGDLLSVVPRSYFFFNRVAIEQWAQKAGFGRSVRKDIQEMQGSWVKAMVAGRKAVAEAGQGLVETPAQEAFMRAQHDLLGKYEGFSPLVRRAVQSVAPFLPWSMAAARFVYWTMPAHHTILTSLLVHSEQVYNQEWKDIHTPVAGLQGGLQDALPTRDGGWVDLARYTPYGLSTPVQHGDLGGITGEFFPQVQGAVKALEGQDAFGRDLKLSSGEDPTAAQKAEIAGYGLLETLLGPIPNQARRLMEHGETSYADSTLWAPKSKAGSSHGMSAARRVYDPLRPTYVGGGGPTIAEPVAHRPARYDPSSPGSVWGAVAARRDATTQNLRVAQQVWDEVHRARSVAP